MTLSMTTLRLCRLLSFYYNYVILFYPYCFYCYAECHHDGDTTLNITTFNKMSLSIMTLSIMTLSITGLFSTLSIDTLHNCIECQYRYAEYRKFLLLC